MDIVAKNLGYRELGRIAKFLESACDCNYDFQDIVDGFNLVQIGYDLHRDEVKLNCYDYENNIFATFYDSNLGIERSTK